MIILLIINADYFSLGKSLTHMAHFHHSRYKHAFNQYNPANITRPLHSLEIGSFLEKKLASPDQHATFVVRAKTTP